MSYLDCWAHELITHGRVTYDLAPYNGKVDQLQTVTLSYLDYRTNELPWLLNPWITHGWVTSDLAPHNGRVD